MFEVDSIEILWCVVSRQAVCRPLERLMQICFASRSQVHTEIMYHPVTKNGYRDACELSACQTRTKEFGGVVENI